MSMFVEEKGTKNATSVVLVHGDGVAGWMWKLQLESLADYHCLVVDLPDHGANRAVPFGTIEECAADLLHLIQERAHDGRAHVVGHSLGAKIALAAIAGGTDSISSAVIASALVRPTWIGAVVGSHTMNALALWMLKSDRVRRAQAKAFHFPDDEYRDRFIQSLAGMTVGSLDRPGKAFASRLCLPAGLGKARCPVCVVAGAREPRVMRDSARDIVAALPGARGFLVDGALHNFPWTHAPAFNALLRAWLQGTELLQEGLQAL
jgi:pimeloyl-ACP methyl ester carboxylesterase